MHRPLSVHQVKQLLTKHRFHKQNSLTNGHIWWCTISFPKLRNAKDFKSYFHIFSFNTYSSSFALHEITELIKSIFLMYRSHQANISFSLGLNADTICYLANIKQILNVFHTPAASTAMTTTVLSYR
jgi:hypothetical protein